MASLLLFIRAGTPCAARFNANTRGAEFYRMLSTVRKFVSPVWMPVVDWVDAVRSPYKKVVLSLFENQDPLAEVFIENRLSQILHDHADSTWATQALRDVVTLRRHLRGVTISGTKCLSTLFLNARSANVSTLIDWKGLAKDLTLENISEETTRTADLVQRVAKVAISNDTWIALLAQRALFPILGYHVGHDLIQESGNFADALLREGGLPFVVMSLLRVGQLDAARTLAQACLTDDRIDEEVRSTLYWITEIRWFTERRHGRMTDFQDVIRYLYHLCFTDPDRTGFLEIDSQFFGQFEDVNELAQEGLLYRETLIEGILDLWRKVGGAFNSEFQWVLEVITQRKNKIYDDRNLWERLWTREKDAFGREALAIVEGNLCFASGHYDDARVFYEKALRIDPKSRAARLNLLFVYARLKNVTKHAAMVQAVVNDAKLYPSCLYNAANSYTVLGDRKSADTFYEALGEVEGWRDRTDYYRSVFCLEHGVLNDAVEFGRRAFKKNPTDMTTAYHLAVCYQSVGEPESALEMLAKVAERPLWLEFFKFTLERDAGNVTAASETLQAIPVEYFRDDNDELEEALEFSRKHRDLALLRHLKRAVALVD